jgi:hypothetical protein
MTVDDIVLLLNGFKDNEPPRGKSQSIKPGFANKKLIPS